jgi:hypothetical protein
VASALKHTRSGTVNAEYMMRASSKRSHHSLQKDVGKTRQRERNSLSCGAPSLSVSYSVPSSSSSLLLPNWRDEAGTMHT